MSEDKKLPVVYDSAAPAVPDSTRSTAVTEFKSSGGPVAEQVPPSTSNGDNTIHAEKRDAGSGSGSSSRGWKNILGGIPKHMWNLRREIVGGLVGLGLSYGINHINNQDHPPPDPGMKAPPAASAAVREALKGDGYKLRPPGQDPKVDSKSPSAGPTADFGEAGKAGTGTALVLTGAGVLLGALRRSAVTKNAKEAAAEAKAAAEAAARETRKNEVIEALHKHLVPPPSGSARKGPNP